MYYWRIVNRAFTADLSHPRLGDGMNKIEIKPLDKKKTTAVSGPSGG